jgi:hypothetical protein
VHLIGYFHSCLRISSRLLTSEGQTEERVYHILLIVGSVLSLVTSYEVGNMATAPPKFKYDTVTLFYSLTLGTTYTIFGSGVFPIPIIFAPMLFQTS